MKTALLHIFDRRRESRRDAGTARRRLSILRGCGPHQHVLGLLSIGTSIGAVTTAMHMLDLLQFKVGVYQHTCAV